MVRTVFFGECDNGINPVWLTDVFSQTAPDRLSTTFFTGFQLPRLSGKSRLFTPVLQSL
jgi:hypothetical protein